MKNFTKVCLVLITMLMASSLLAQTKITGVIMDGEINQSLAGANVFVKGTQVGATTDLDGKFELTTTESSGTLLVSFLGKKTCHPST